MTEECNRHFGIGIIIIQDDPPIEMCYGCWVEQFTLCPLCGKAWDNHPGEEVECRKENNMGENGLLLTQEERDEVYYLLPARATCGEERIAYCKAQLAKALKELKKNGIPNYNGTGKWECELCWEALKEEQ